MANIKAVLFDLHGTLAYVENPVSSEEISNHLFSRGYEVSPQQLNAAWAFVAFVDYPKKRIPQLPFVFLEYFLEA